MSLIIYKEKLRALVSKDWEMDGNKGTTHFMQTEYKMPDGSLQIRKIKVKPEMLSVIAKLVDQSIDVVCTTFAKVQGGKPFVDYMAIQPPTASR